MLKYEQQNYYELREDCLRKGVLFEDDLFGTSSSSYYLHGRTKVKENIEWLRPCQIVSSDASVDFIHTSNSLSLRKKLKEQLKSNSVDFRHQFNFLRGRSGCTNFISALSVLYCNEDNFSRVIQDDQSFDSNYYTGKFSLFAKQI